MTSLAHIRRPIPTHKPPRYLLIAHTPGFAHVVTVNQNGVQGIEHFGSDAEAASEYVRCMEGKQ